MEDVQTSVAFLAVALGVPLLGLLIGYGIDWLKADAQKRFRIAGIPPIFVLIVGAVLVLTGVLLFCGLIVLILAVMGLRLPEAHFDLSGESGVYLVLRLAGLTTVLGALIALPFTVYRLQLTKEQTETAAETLLNEKINAATQSLYARRQVTKAVTTLDSGYQGHQDFWEDDIVERCAAIDRLEGLAEANRDEIPRVARLLSVYVRELSKNEVPPVEMPKSQPMDEMGKWAQQLPALRSDMEKAAQTLGHLTKFAIENGAPLHNGEVDLRGANLQRADLRQLNFEQANLSAARLQGANLDEARLQGAYLNEARLRGADLDGARFSDTTSLSDATLRGASLRDVDFTPIPDILDQVAEGFGDASVTLPNGVNLEPADWPKHWPKRVLDFREYYDAYTSWLTEHHPDLAD